MKARLTLALLALTGPLAAYDADFGWPSGTREFRVLLDNGTTRKALPTAGLSDGSANWSAVMQGAAAVWNEHLRRIQISLTSASGEVTTDNGRNEISFSDKAFGEDFGERTLAVTYSLSDASINRIRLAEADILVNTKFAWDSYRGALRSGATDLRRVLIHEMGHALGLNHPDQAQPPQEVDAIMNAAVSDVSTVREDDIAGVVALYGTPITVPRITRQPQGGNVNVGENADVYIETEGGTPPSSPTLSYSWIYTPPLGRAEWLFGQPEARIPFGTAQIADSGTYRVRIETPDGDVDSASTQLNVQPVALQPSTRLYNLSTRGYVGDGDRALVVGFVLRSATTRKVLVRGIGPGLASFGVANVLGDPILDVRRVADDTQVGQSDSWSSENQGATAAVFQAAGAFSLPTGSKDAALVLDLPAGNYTATLRPKSGTAPGIGMVEMYDISPTHSLTERLYNLSTRGYVASETDILVAGLSVSGNGPRTYLIRGAGDTLKQFNLSGTLDDPVLRLFDPTGRLLRYADDWDNPSSQQDALREVMSRAGAFAFEDRQESALKLTLKPGNYTVHLGGLKGGTGTAIVEIYELDE